MEWKKEYSQKLVSHEEAVRIVKSGDKVYTGTASSVAYGLAEALWERRNELEGVEIQSSQAFEPSPLYGNFDENPFSYNTYFVGVNERKALRSGMSVDFNSVHLSQVDIWCRQNARPDVAFFEVSLPDENGYMSYGPSGVAIAKDIKAAAKKIVLEVNSKVPYVYGEDNLIHVSEADLIVEYERPIMSYETPAADETAQQLSKLIIDEVPDGATIQLGLGNISTAIGYGLKTKNDLGIHTELFNQPMLDLIENGNVTNKHKGFMDGKTVYSFALGTEKLYDALDKNPDYYCIPFTYANDPRVIAQNKKMISINTTMSIDLYGQAASDCLGWRQQSATGGQVDFVRGAQWSEGGKSFIATTSSFIKDGKRVSRIVPCFAPGSVVTTTRSDIQYVATEYGCVNLKPLNAADRARAIISLAHPEFRELLTDEAKKYGII
ncbi:MAG: acetyl-CoA hydrolase [Firmicutes bacterium]|nr:acetyl-CoA hydrolase [Bacillota bacterium]